MSPTSSKRRLKLRHAVFLALLLSGIIPLLTFNLLQLRQNRGVLEAEERTALTESADLLSREVGTAVESLVQRLEQLGNGLLAAPGSATPRERLRQPWVGSYLEGFVTTAPSVSALRVLDLRGVGPSLGGERLSGDVSQRWDDVHQRALDTGQTAYAFSSESASGEPLAIVAVPIPSGSFSQLTQQAQQEQVPRLIVEAVARVPLVPAVLRRRESSDASIFLIDEAGRVVWSAEDGVTDRDALERSGLLQSFARAGMAMTQEFEGRSTDRKVSLLAQVSPIGETGWALVIQKPAAAAFAAIDRLVLSALIATAVLVLLALAFALYVARWLGAPIQRLAHATREIAEGNFSRRVAVGALPFEFGDLAVDFDQMSEHVRGHVEKLRFSARQNQDLFIGSIRAFAAAIDAKDPYTRGHSERVAALAKKIARYLSLPEDFQHKVWLGALLHDVGKIGVEDRILQKTGQFSDEEFEMMKLHTVIGAEIMTSIEQLRDMIPAIRWHHEAWNGKGYPDGKRGEEIPLMARIVCVADTFDAVTTNRPYQKAFTLEEAIETVTKLTGTRFDAKVVTAFLQAHKNGEVRLPSDEVEDEPLTIAVTDAGLALGG